MNHDGGFTRQYRRMWDNPVFRTYQEAAVFSWMKDIAQWRETTIRTKFGPIRLGIGEFLMAERATAEAFGLHRNSLRALIRRMLDDGMISEILDRCPQRAGTVYRIKNYEEYQGISDVPVPEEDRKRTANGTGAGPEEDRKRTKNNEENEVKERNQESLALTGGEPDLAEQGLQIDQPANDNPPESKPSLDEEFDGWYRAYPRRVGRGQALKAYRSARKKADAVTLLVAAQAFAKASAGRDPQYLPHPATWLNGERWLDDQKPAQPPPANDAAPRPQLRDILAKNDKY